MKMGKVTNRGIYRIRKSFPLKMIMFSMEETVVAYLEKNVNINDQDTIQDVAMVCLFLMEVKVVESLKKKLEQEQW